MLVEFRPALFRVSIGNNMHTTSNQAAHQPSLAVLLASSFAFIIVQLDVTIVNVALPRMGLELGAEVSTLQWVVDAYTLASPPSCCRPAWWAKNSAPSARS